MSSNQQYEKALRLLEAPAAYPGLPIHERSVVPLRLWRYPSFQPCSSWAVVENVQGLFVRRVTWDQRHSLAVEPVTYGSEVRIDASLFEGLLARLRAIELPPFIVVSTHGIDGTTYGVEVGAYGLSARLSWWSTPPPPWAELQRWHAEAVERFEAVLPASTSSLVDR